MTFSSINFIFTFLPLILVIYRLTPVRFHNMVLLTGSLIFYAWGNVYHMFGLVIIILMNYVLGRYIDCRDGRVRMRRLLEALIINISILLYFKYYGFVLESVFAFLPHPPAYSLFSIPLGISFFTFSIIAYLVDVYRHTIPAETNLTHFALFVSFFPKLIMGPIERYADMKEQMEYHPMRHELLEQGCSRFMIGLAQKLILANTMGSIWSMCQTSQISMAGAWLGILAYTFQIYFDFQGYTQMAIGLGNMFGFQLSQNFRYPYTAFSITDFWRRWHITLSAWFKDYVYIPLGGNRTSFDKVLRNLLVVWALTGLWHGASWNFIFWGLYYGILLIIEKFIVNEKLERLPVAVRWLITFVLVMIGWVFFASDDLSSAFGYLGSMLMMRGNGTVDVTAISILRNYGLYFLLAAVSCTPFLKNCAHRLRDVFKEQLWYLKPILGACFFMILLSFLVSNTYQAFLYFKF